MKKIKALMILLSLVTVFSLNIFSQPDRFNDRDHSRDHSRDRARDVGVPLDGGLLAILGAAGVAYFAARKKKKE